MIEKINRNKRLLIIPIVGIILMMTCMSMTAFADSNNVIVPYLDTGYKYKIVDKGAEPGFEDPDYDDSLFMIGDAGFGSIRGIEPNTPKFVKTTWPITGEDILIRKEFEVLPGTTNMKIGVAIDNDVQAFVNGVDVSDGLKKHDWIASRDTFVFDVPDEILVPGENILALRGQCRGVASYLDVQVTADVPSTSTNIPEFPAIAIPMICIIGLMFLFQRK